MRKHIAGLYVLSAIELLLAGPLVVGAWVIWPQLLRALNVRMDDYLAFSALGVTGLVSAMAGAATLFHSALSYGSLRLARSLAIISDVWMLLAGIGMWLVTRHFGGDWAGFGYLGAMIFIVLGFVLLGNSLVAFRLLRRLEPANPAG